MKICLFGYTGHYGRPAAEMQLCPQAQLLAAAPGSIHEDTGRFANYNVPIYENYQEMLDQCKPDVAIVAPVFGLTGQIIMECAKRGIDVFSDKPVAGTLAELAQVERSVAESGIRFSAMHFLRFTPSFYHARRLIADGGIGDVRMLTAQKSYKYGTRPDWYQDRTLYTGTIPWIGIHAIDWIYYFAQKPFCAVSAVQTGTPEMAALCQFRMADGVIAAANIDYLRSGAAPTHGDDRIRVAGTKGVAEVFEDHYTVIDSDGVREYRPTEAPKLAHDFLMRREEITPQEIFMLTKIALLARESADTGRWIEMEAEI